MFLSWLLRLYKALLYLYPPGFRAEFADEMQEVFAQAVRDASQRSSTAMAKIYLNELLCLPGGLLRAYQPVSVRAESRSSQMLGKPTIIDRSWGELALSLLIFLLPAGVILMNPSPAPATTTSWIAAAFFLIVMLVIGWLGGFPLWSLPYIGIVLVIAGYLYLFQWLIGLISPTLITNFSPGPWNQGDYLVLRAAATGMSWLLLFCLTLLVVALLVVSNHLRPLLVRLRHDWTLLSYVLYGEAVFILAFLFQRYHYSPNYQIASLICLLAGVWIFLRCGAPWQRLLALVICMTLAMGIGALDGSAQAGGGETVSWGSFSPVIRARLIISWIWISAALLLPGLLSRWPMKSSN